MEIHGYRNDRWSAGRRAFLGTVASVALAVAVAGCSSFESSFEERAVLGVTLEVPSTSGAASAVSSSVVVDEGGETLTIDSVTVVLEEIQIARQGQECVFSNGEPDTDECNEVPPGGQPVAQDLPLDSGFVQLRAFSVDTGTFDAVEFQFTALDQTDPRHQDALAGPVPNGASVRIWGDHDGQDVDVTVDLDDEHRLSVPSVDVGAQEVAEFTLTFDVSVWFLTESDGSPALVDARDGLDATEEEIVEENIRASLDASVQKES